MAKKKGRSTVSKNAGNFARHYGSMARSQGRAKDKKRKAFGENTDRLTLSADNPSIGGTEAEWQASHGADKHSGKSVLDSRTTPLGPHLDRQRGKMEPPVWASKVRTRAEITRDAARGPARIATNADRELLIEMLDVGMVIGAYSEQGQGSRKMGLDFEMKARSRLEQAIRTGGDIESLGIHLGSTREPTRASQKPQEARNIGNGYRTTNEGIEAARNALTSLGEIVEESSRRTYEQAPKPVPPITCSEALELLLKLRAMIRDPKSMKRLASWLEADGYTPDAITEYTKTRRQILDRCEPYFIEQHICKFLIEICQHDIPAYSITPADLLTPYGFVCFQTHPVVIGPGLVNSPFHKTGDETVRLRAITWANSLIRPDSEEDSEGNETRITEVQKPEDGMVPALEIQGWFDVGDDTPAALPGPLTCGYITFDQGEGSKIIHTSEIKGATVYIGGKGQRLPWDALVTRLFQVVQIFSKQTLFKYSERQMERAARRRLEKSGWKPEQIRSIHVVTLRRTEYVGRGPKGESGRHLTCQHLVRGHYRKYHTGPGRKQITSKWILPHIKGPKDAPLRPPGTRVFDVAR